MSVRGWFGRTKDYICDFRQEKSFGEKMSIVITVLFFQLLYIWAVITALTALFSRITLQKYIYWGWLSGQDVASQLQASLTKSLMISLFFAVVLAPIWEEFAFRTYWFWKKLRKRDKEEFLQPEVVAKLKKVPIWDFVIFSSIIFGIAHGGPINILIQGMGGLFLSYVFLRNGRCYWSAVALHALYNGILIGIVYFLGAKSAIFAITMPYWLMWF